MMDSALPTTTANLTKLRTYKSLDAWRGVAALLVVLHHAGATLAAQYPSLRSEWLYKACNAGFLGVQIFFVISGYCIASAAGRLIAGKSPTLTFARDRFMRIFPPYWAAILLVAATGYAATVLTHHAVLASSTTANLNILRQPLPYYAANLFLIQPIVNWPFIITQSWTLCYELAFYLALAVALFFASNVRSEKFLLSSMHVVTLIALVLLIAIPRHLNYPIDLWAEFGYGVLAYDYLSYGRNPATLVFTIGICLLTLVFVCAHSLPLGLLSEPSRAATLVSVAFAISCVALYAHDDSIAKHPVVKLFAGLGIYSYSLYLVHTVALGFVSQIARVAHLAVSANLVLLVLMVCASLLLGRLFYAMCERPFTKRRKIYAAPSASAALPPRGRL